jgi:hypothetical protein
MPTNSRKASLASNVPCSYLPHSDAKYHYFRYYKDGNSWIGWFPRKFVAALNAYLAPMSSRGVSVTSIAKKGTAEFLCIRGGGLALSIIVDVISRQLKGDLRSPTEKTWLREKPKNDKDVIQAPPRNAWEGKYPKSVRRKKTN